MKTLRAIEVVEDLTLSSRCDAGFLRLARLRLKNVYEDGSESAVYPCDVVSRRRLDAVVAVLYRRDEEGNVLVVLREGPRAPVYLRKLKRSEHFDAQEVRVLHEVVAGLLEREDGRGKEGLGRRAAVEAEEEAGLSLPPAAFREIGEGTFASPGTSDEKVYYTAADGAAAGHTTPRGDGSVMEECSRILERELGAAIEACRRGEVPDMKTEIALLRLADHLGFLPQLGCFVEDLPPALQKRYRRLGVDEAPPRGAR